MTTEDGADHLIIGADARDGATAELRVLVDEMKQAKATPATPAPKARPKKDIKRMNRDKPELPAYALAIIALICIAVLTFHGDKVPDILNLATIGALGIGGAVTQVPRPPPA